MLYDARLSLRLLRHVIRQLRGVHNRLDEGYGQIELRILGFVVSPRLRVTLLDSTREASKIGALFLRWLELRATYEHASVGGRAGM